MTEAAPLGPAGRPSAEVGRRLAEEFGLGTFRDLVGPVDRGEQGQVWQLSTAAGDFAVKETFPGFAAVITEERAAECLAFHTAAVQQGIRSPGQHRTADGRCRFELGNVPLRIFDWLPMDPPHADLDPAAVGRVLAGLHRAGRHQDGLHQDGLHQNELHRTGSGRADSVDPWFTEPVGAEVWDDLVERVRSAGAPFADALAAYRDDLVALEGVYRPMTPVQVCHRDLFADNVRTTPNGEVCVIDWDNCGPADPDRELAFCLVEYARTDPDRGRPLIAAYRDAGGPGRVRRPEDFGMVSAQLGHLGELWLRRWLAADAIGERRAADMAVAGTQEFLTDPLTPASVDTLLAAAAG